MKPVSSTFYMYLHITKLPLTNLQNLRQWALPQAHMGLLTKSLIPCLHNQTVYFFGNFYVGI